MSGNLTIILALFAAVLTVFGAAWFNHRATERIIGLLDKRLDERFTALNKRLDARFAAIDAKFDTIINRMTIIESRLERIERQLEEVLKLLLPPALTPDE